MSDDEQEVKEIIIKPEDETIDLQVAIPKKKKKVMTPKMLENLKKAREAWSEKRQLEKGATKTNTEIRAKRRELRKVELQRKRDKLKELEDKLKSNEGEDEPDFDSDEEDEILIKETERVNKLLYEKELTRGKALALEKKQTKEKVVEKKKPKKVVVESDSESNSEDEVILTKAQLKKLLSKQKVAETPPPVQRAPEPRRGIQYGFGNDNFGYGIF